MKLTLTKESDYRRERICGRKHRRNQEDCPYGLKREVGEKTGGVERKENNVDRLRPRCRAES